MKINAFIKILVNKSKLIKEQKARGLICNLTGTKVPILIDLAILNTLL